MATIEDYKYLFKVVLVGNAGVGKTCLVRRFTQGMFPPGQGATIGVDFMIKTVEVDGEKIKVQSHIHCKYTISLFKRKALLQGPTSKIMGDWNAWILGIILSYMSPEALAHDSAKCSWVYELAYWFD